LGTFFKRYVQWRAGIIWWLIVLFGALLALTLVGALIIGPSVVTEFLKNIGLILPTYLLTLVVGVILGPLWEEPGWRGFALPRLQAQFGPLVGTLILGVLWAYGISQVTSADGWGGAPGADHIQCGIFHYHDVGLQHAGQHPADDPAALSRVTQRFPLEAKCCRQTCRQHECIAYGGWVPAITYTIMAVGVILITRGNYRMEEAIHRLRARRKLKEYPVSTISQFRMMMVPRQLADDRHGASEARKTVVKAKQRFSDDILAAIRRSHVIGLRAGTQPHRFIGIWAVVVEQRVFVRSWSLKPASWYRVFREEPRGTIQIDGREIAVRAVRTRSERLKAAIDRAYLEKYTPGSIKFAHDPDAPSPEPRRRSWCRLSRSKDLAGFVEFKMLAKAIVYRKYGSPEVLNLKMSMLTYRR
jgi:hypothetical protein